MSDTTLSKAITSVRSLPYLSEAIYKVRNSTPNRLSSILMDAIVRSLPNPYTGQVNGMKMTFNLEDKYVSRSLLFRGVWEPYQSRLLTNLSTRNSVFIDVGANVGYYTLMLATKVKQILAFEPDPGNFSLLKHNVEQNNIVNVVLENRGISNSTGNKKLFLSEDNYGDHRLWSNGGKSWVDVDLVRLDDYLDLTGLNVDLIKMDIQGAEWHALEGMKRTIEENRHMKIVTEFWPKGLVGMGANPLNFLRSLSDSGFTLFAIDEVRKRLMPVPDSKFADYADIQGSVNLICMPVTDHPVV